VIILSPTPAKHNYADFDAARKAAVKSGALLYTIVARPVKNEFRAAHRW